MTDGGARAAAALVDAMFGDEARFGTTYAAVVVRDGAVLAERYGGTLPSRTGSGRAVGPDTPLHSWSVAKSVLHAAVGVLVGEDVLVPNAPAPVPEWGAPGDPRSAITLEHLLCMRDGLAFGEEYDPASGSDVIEMLFGAGQGDVAHFAADRPLAHSPGSTFNYSSGSSNIISGIVARGVGTGPEMERFLREAVFDPIGMESATVRCDAAGTFIGSSYVYATARDWVRFGQCYLRDGVARGGQVLPEGWVEHGHRARSVDSETGWVHGAHWWVLDEASEFTFFANGYEGQRVVVCPALDLVAVRFGRSSAEHRDALQAWCREVVAVCAAGSTFTP